MENIAQFIPGLWKLAASPKSSPADFSVSPSASPSPVFLSLVTVPLLPPPSRFYNTPTVKRNVHVYTCTCIYYYLLEIKEGVQNYILIMYMRRSSWVCILLTDKHLICTHTTLQYTFTRKNIESSAHIINMYSYCSHNTHLFSFLLWCVLATRTQKSG